MHFPSERGMKPGCLKLIPLQTLERADSESAGYAFEKLPERKTYNYDYIWYILEVKEGARRLLKKGESTRN